MPWWPPVRSFPLRPSVFTRRPHASYACVHMANEHAVQTTVAHSPLRGHSLLPRTLPNFWLFNTKKIYTTNVLHFIWDLFPSGENICCTSVCINISKNWQTCSRPTQSRGGDVLGVKKGRGNVQGEVSTRGNVRIPFTRDSCKLDASIQRRIGIGYHTDTVICGRVTISVVGQLREVKRRRFVVLFK